MSFGGGSFTEKRGSSQRSAISKCKKAGQRPTIVVRSPALLFLWLIAEC
jgi:hypothetical protein